MDGEPISRASAAHAARLERTLKDLQNRVKEQEAALEKLRALSQPIEAEPSSDARVQLSQIRTLTEAYKALTPKEPYLPSPESPLPALLALRNTYNTISSTRIALQEAEAELAKTQDRLKQEQADLSDAQLIAQSLEARIVTLRQQIADQTQKPPAEIARDIVRELRKKKARYDSETGRLVKAFNAFVDEHLAAMLAAEELGGLVVGELLDISDLSLEAGFNAQGRPKRAKESINEDRRQRRIDEIWGPRPEEDGSGQDQEPWNEKRAAAAEMRELTEQLLNNLVEADGGSDVYVQLERESAAARFLVRSKVAQFHPRDARKLRLIDFGRDLDD